MGLLSREDILKADDIPTEDIDVPEWGGQVRVRGLTGAGRDAYFASLTRMRKGQQVPDTINATAKLVARTVIDPDTGNLMFTDDDVYQLGLRSAAALGRVEDTAMRLSGLTQEDMDLEGKARMVGSPQAEGSTPSGSSISG